MGVILSNIEIQDLSSNHTFRTELPNILFEIGLHPILIGVYAALKRCAGDYGKCTKSIKTLCSQLQISKNTLKGWINKLCEINPILKKPLIISQERRSEHGDSDTHCISIIDIWSDNLSYFKDKNGGGSKIDPPRSKIDPGVGQKLTQGGSKIDPKEEQHKKNLYEEETTTPKIHEDVVDVFSFLKNFSLNEEEVIAIKRALKKFSPERINLAAEYSKYETPTVDLVSMLVWHCKEPIAPISNKKDQKDIVIENKKYAKDIKKNYEAKNYRIDILQNSIEFVPNSGQISPDVLNFTCKTFKKDIENILKNRKFTRKKDGKFD